MNRPIRLTTLAEDFRAIGLLAPSASAPAARSSKKRRHLHEDAEMPTADQAMPEPEEDEKDEEEEMGTEVPVAAVEAKRLVRAEAKRFLASYGAKPKTSSKRESRNKPVAKKPLKESRAQRLQRLAEGRIFVPSAAPSRASSKIDRLLEEVGSIVGDLSRSRKVEQIEGFANISVIAGTLHKRFSTLGMRLAEGSIYRVGEEMKRLSEDAGDMALDMDGGDPSVEPPAPPAAEDDAAPDAGGDDAKVDLLFKKFMAKLLDALQLYNDVSGKSEEDEMPGDDAAVAEDGEEEDPEAAVGEDGEEDPEAPPVDEDDEEPEGDEVEEDDEEEEEPAVAAEGVESPYGVSEEDEEEPTEEDEEDPVPAPVGAVAQEHVRKLLGLGVKQESKAQRGKAKSRRSRRR